MEFISDPNIYRPKVVAAIDLYGTSGDHHLQWWELTPEKDDAQPVFVTWSDGTGILTHREKDFWTVWSDPLMPETVQGERLADFCWQALSDPIFKSVWFMDVSPVTRRAILTQAGDNLKVRNVYYTLHWPVHDMNLFNPALPGGDLKEIRNARSKFYREHQVQVVPANQVQPVQLKEIVERWAKRRMHRDRAYPRHYLRFINNGFDGAVGARVLIVDGQSVGFNVGWMVPNSETYYGGIGLHDYSHRDLGLILHLEDLEWIKSQGYKRTDQAGSEKGGPLNFKLRFKPQEIYKTYTFSVAKRV